MKPETRTLSVRIELPNSDGELKPGMYADVVFHAGDGEAAITAVPDSAIIDSGTRQVVLVAKGDGRFEPRAVKLGRRGEWLCGDHGGPDGRRGGRHLSHLPDRRREQSQGRAAKLQPEERSHDRRASFAGRPATSFWSLLATLFVTARRHLCGLPRAARRDPRPLRRPGHRLHRVSGPGAAGGRGPGHLSADHRDADRAAVAASCAASPSSASPSST